MADYSDADIQRIVKIAVKEAMAQTVAMPRDDISAIAAAAARTAVQEAHVRIFAALGFDMANMKDINRLRANLDFLNAFHRNTAAAAGKMMLVAAALLVGGVFTAFWIGFKSAVHR